MKVAAVVLAAGASTRMGRVKQTLPWGESTVIETVISALEAAGVGMITVVLGFHWEAVYPVVEDLDVQVFVNPRPERGMLSSAQWALAQMRDDIDAFLFCLGDQPQIQPDTVCALIRAAAASEEGIVLPTFEGKRGHPLLVRARHKAEILALPETGGLNRLLQNHPEEILEIPVQAPTILSDLDTPEEYARLQAR